LKRPEENRQVVRWIVDAAPQDGTVLDVGGNVGKISERVAEQRPDVRILLFEPVTHFAAKAAARLERWAPRVGVFPFGLSDQETDATIYIDNDNPGWSTLDPAYAEGKHTAPVHLKRLDDLGLGRVDVIKLDVEYWEGKVLKGGRRTIDRFKPVIVSELSRGTEDLWYERVGEMERLFDIGYRRIDYRVTSRINVVFTTEQEAEAV